jgi:hypothetical protein
MVGVHDRGVALWQAWRPRLGDADGMEVALHLATHH